MPEKDRVGVGFHSISYLVISSLTYDFLVVLSIFFTFATQYEIWVSRKPIKSRQIKKKYEKIIYNFMCNYTDL